jgi:hypothetical protein
MTTDTSQAEGAVRPALAHICLQDAALGSQLIRDAGQ